MYLYPASQRERCSRTCLRRSTTALAQPLAVRWEKNCRAVRRQFETWSSSEKLKQHVSSKKSMKTAPLYLPHSNDGRNKQGLQRRSRMRCCHNSAGYVVAPLLALHGISSLFVLCSALVPRGTNHKSRKFSAPAFSILMKPYENLPAIDGLQLQVKLTSWSVA